MRRKLMPLSRSHFLELCLQLGPQDSAVSNIAHAPRSTLVVTNLTLLSIDLPGRTHSIAPLVRAGRDDDVRKILDPSDAVQTITNYLSLRRELRFVGELLKVTTTAADEVRTGGFNAHGRRREDFFD